MDRWQPSELSRLKALIGEIARQRGAAAVRITSAHSDASTREALRASIARGDLANWPYDDAYAERAASPQSLLANARAVICVAMPYASEPPPSPPLSGRVSSYAWSADYHHRVKAILSEIAQTLDRAAGETVTAIACDTKPIAERAFAARAGLGWFGKHSNLINPEYGSFVFLGEVVTTIPFEPDPALRKTCGACTRCIPACPTRAIRGDYTIDASRCIADLTQRTDEIPRELRPLVGTWVWGCDLCQTACPPNRRARKPSPVENAPISRETAVPALLDLLQLRSGTFKRTYAKTAMGWRGAAILRRNAAVALGNALDRSSLAALGRALANDPHPMVRSHVAWALGRIGSPPAVLALRAALHRERDDGVLREIRQALEPFGTDPAFS